MAAPLCGVPQVKVRRFGIARRKSQLARMPARQEWILILKATVSFVRNKDALQAFLQGPAASTIWTI